MNVIFLIGSVQALFFAILIFNKKGKNISDIILGVWMLMFAIQLIFPFLVYGENYKDYIQIAGSDVPLVVLYSAFLYVYANALIVRENKFQKKWLWHILPFVIVFLTMIPYWQISIEDKIAIYENRMQMPGYFFWLPSIIVLFSAIYIFLTLRLLNQHRKDIKKEYSYEKNINLIWLRNLIIAIIIVTVLITTEAIILEMRGITIFQGDFVLYAFLVVLIYVIGYWGYKQGRIFVYGNQVKSNVSSKKEKKDEPNFITINKQDQAFIEQLKAFMENEKPYLDNELNLYQLSSGLNVSTTYLSSILNNSLHTNFYGFVNQYRVKEVQQRICRNEQQNFTLLSIAYDSGFNSKASFNRIFKEVTGMTPSEYQKSGKIF